MQKNNNKHIHRYKKTKYIIYRPKNTCKSMRWLRLLFFDEFCKSWHILLTEHWNLCSEFTGGFLIIDLILRKAENLARIFMFMEMQEAE